MKILSSIFFLVLFIRLDFQGQTSTYKDSDLASAKEDSVKCKILDWMVDKEDDPKIWIKYNEQMQVIAESKLKTTDGKERIVYLRFLSNAINNKAFYLQNIGDIDSALVLFRKGLEIRYDIKNKEGVANSLNNIGHIYYSKADFQKAIEYYSKCIKVQEEIGDKVGLGTSYNNLGAVYERIGNYEEALRLFNKSLETRKGINDFKGQAFCYNNLAKINFEKGDLKKALDFQFQALKIRESINDKQNIGVTYNNIGMLFLESKDYAQAQEYFEKGIKVHEETDDKQSLGVSYSNLGVLNSKQKKYTKAEQYFNKALKISQELGFPEDIYKPAKGLYEVYKFQGNYKGALAMFELYRLMKDSSEKKQMAFVPKKQIAVFQTETASTTQDSTDFEARLKGLEGEIQSKNSLIYILSTLLGLTLIFTAFKSFKSKK